MSAVYKARQISLDRIVVLKILPPAMARDKDDIGKFLSEAKLTAQLKHPNIVQVYDFGRSPDGIYYFVMEFVSGYSVGEWVRRKKTLSREDALLCAHCVAEALHYAWDKAGIIHCDIKPDNVMIDGDGTVKVADLGLARSVRSMLDQARSGSDVVMGTPHYISPEQSRGGEELDCRTDIYALGAMLYHCLTGKMPFEGLPLVEVMDRQISDQIPDLLEINPELSPAVACMIEKMMAKARDMRHKDWREVMRDIVRARNNLLPEGALPPLGASTLRRSTAREGYLQKMAAAPAVPPAHHHVVAHVAPPLAPGGAHTPVPTPAVRPARRALRHKEILWVLGALLCGIVVGSGFFALGDGLRRRSKESQPDAPAAHPANVERGSHDAAAGAFPAEQIAKRVDDAIAWARAHPEQYPAALELLKKTAAEAHGLSCAARVAAEIGAVRQRHNDAVKAAMLALREQAEPMLKNRKYVEAAVLFEQYKGKFAGETARERAEQASAWRKQADLQLEQQQRMAEKRSGQWKKLLHDAAVNLVNDNAGGALELVRQAEKQFAGSELRRNYHDLRALLESAAGMDERLLNSFRAQKGQEIKLMFADGHVRSFYLRDVQDVSLLVEEVILVSAGEARRQKTIAIAGLALDEFVQRLGTENEEERALLLGLLLMRAGDLSRAEEAWTKVGPLLKASIRSALEERASLAREEQARRVFRDMLRYAGIEHAGDFLQPHRYLALFDQNPLPPSRAKTLAVAADDYQKQYAATQFAAAYAPVLEAFKRFAAEPFVAPAPAMSPAEERLAPNTGADLETVRRQLIERNPMVNPDCIVLRAGADGRLERVEIISEHVFDLTPLAGLASLKTLICAATPTEEWRDASLMGVLTNLAPIRGLALKALILNNMPIRDITPLAGMSLSKLNLASTHVADLSVLKGMPLCELWLSRVPARDWSFLTGMPLETLVLNHTGFNDMNLLNGMRLKRLNLAGTFIASLKILHGMPLQYLNVNLTAVSDLTALNGMPIEQLLVSRTRVRSLSLLNNMLRRLDASSTDVRDLTPLRHTLLQELILNNTPVSDLSSLGDLSLQSLDISSTKVRDLRPLQRMPLKYLNISQTPIKDLRPLQDMVIEELWLDQRADYRSRSEMRELYDVLARMPRLQKLNGNQFLRERLQWQ